MFASLMWTLTRTSVYFSILAAAFQVKLGSRLPLNFLVSLFHMRIIEDMCHLLTGFIWATCLSSSVIAPKETQNIDPN